MYYIVKLNYFSFIKNNMKNQQNQFNSYTDGNRVTAVNNTNIGQFSGPDTPPRQNTSQIKNASMQQSSTMHKMPPNPNPGKLTGKPWATPMKDQNMRENCNCK